MPKVHKNPTASRIRKIVLLVVTTVVLVYVTFVGENSIISLLKYKKEVTANKAALEKTEAILDSLNRENDKLENDDRTIEKIAREEYDMQRPDEKVTIIKKTDEDK